MTIDFHAHLARHDPHAPAFLRHMFDVEGYLERQADAGIELTVLSYALSDLEGTAKELEEAKAEHDFLAGLVADHPDRFVALAGLDPFGGDPWLEEGRRALEAGFAGFCFPTSRQGAYLDADAAQDGFALVQEERAVLFVHPSDSPITAERAGDPVLEAWIGLPFDTGICLSRMLLADTLARYPQVRMVVAHSGGALPMVLGRLDHVLASFERRAAMERGGGPPGGPPDGKPRDGGPHRGPPDGKRIPEELALRPALAGRPPSERVGQLYFDTAGYHQAALMAAIGAVGIDRVVVGTDFPPVGDSPAPMLATIERLDLSPDEREKITAANARALLADRRAAQAVDHT